MKTIKEIKVMEDRGAAALLPVCERVMNNTNYEGHRIAENETAEFSFANVSIIKIRYICIIKIRYIFIEKYITPLYYKDTIYFDLGGGKMPVSEAQKKPLQNTRKKNTIKY